MTHRLLTELQSKVSFPEQDFEKLEAVLSKRIVKKKKNLLNEGDICRHYAFVEMGCLRSYSIDDRGTEHVVQLALEGHWIGDLYSITTQTPATLNIEALEDSHLLLLHYRDVDRLLEEIPVLETYFRKLYQRAYVQLQQRLNTALSVSAEQRYKELIEQHPNLLQRVPLIHIASYLGITPESLSRIRKLLSP